VGYLQVEQQRVEAVVLEVDAHLQRLAEVCRGADHQIQQTLGVLALQCGVHEQHVAVEHLYILVGDLEQTGVYLHAFVLHGLHDRL